MKGLLLKDYYTLTRQMKLFLLMVVVFACIPGYSVSGFAILYATLLPMTALAYDERCKWDALAAAMPLSVQDIVLSKYILGWCCGLGAAILSVAGQAAAALIRHQPVSSAEVLAVPAIIFLLAVLLQALDMPFLFRLGVEKGRLIFLGMMLAVTLCIVTFLKSSTLTAKDGALLLGSLRLSIPAAAAWAAALTVLANAVSVRISMRVYRDKQA